MIYSIIQSINHGLNDSAMYSLYSYVAGVRFYIKQNTTKNNAEINFNL